MSRESKPADLLIEIGTEELPPASLKTLMLAFADILARKFDDARLAHGEIHAYATPRRLAVLAGALHRSQPDQAESLRGPPLKIAFDEDGKPTRAAEAFAQKCGVDVASLAAEKTDKGEWLVHNHTVAGLSTAEVLPQLVRDALGELPVARRMRWGASDEEFVRPVQWIVLLHGTEVIAAELFGQQAGRQSRGHRFHAPDPIRLDSAADYEPRLEHPGRVIVDFSKRREIIRTQIDEAAASLEAGVETDDALLDEITALVEWPSTVTGDFNADYLRLPREVLISTLKKHQRYFPVIGDKGELRPHFITVANIESKDPARVSAGNERVVSPRLADAEFFWRTDKRIPLANRLDRLRDVVYEERLGSIYDKSDRAARLATAIAEVLGRDIGQVKRAAMLARCDLVTEMVGEFPDLQGIMGAYYARADGEPETVSISIGEFYKPAFSKDSIAESAIGRIVVIADRLDTLAGVFAIGKRPSGNRDPFGLRRAALGLARTIIEGELELDIMSLIDTAFRMQPVATSPQDLNSDLYDFIVDRLKAYFIEQNPAATNEVFQTVLDRRPVSLLDFRLRLDAVIAFDAMDAAESLAAANKRISNILRQAGYSDAAGVNVDRLTESAEKTLFQKFNDIEKSVSPLLRNRDYTRALAEMARLREPVDRFFDDVMVMSEDQDVRRNRLSLLAGIRGLFLEVADISVLSRN